MKDTNFIQSPFARAIINIALIISAAIGVWFFISHWDRPLTDATVFSAILVEIPIQVLIQRQKQ